ncbi:hypothetical protein IQ273_28115 [Nodosilinea sp. LEGE 07298]|uniref:hypothetical protein n=1 Tax=Nodosilinea sp. LEGE 07298 TaxID=2777970 RepID=UPI001881B93F|nr:hypothetical protein [Nodosilinea sp. LEGE 07298]MBE9113247.1 hypothetical protein [Nodosilinea sp. LEGE 07298]
MGLTLGDGEFEGMRMTWLRWCDREGNLLPTGAERAAQAETKAARLAARLQELGVDPEEVENGV